MCLTSILPSWADVSAEILLLQFQDSFGEVLLVVPLCFVILGCWQMGIRMRWNAYFTACDLTQASNADWCPNLKCWDSLRLTILAALMVLSQISQWWILFGLRLSFCQQMLNFHSKKRKVFSSPDGGKKLENSIHLQEPTWIILLTPYSFQAHNCSCAGGRGPRSWVFECLELPVLLFIYHCKIVVRGF